MKNLGKRIRKRLETVLDSEAVTGTATRLIARRLNALHDRTDWTYHGRDALLDEVRAGQPVIMALWHGRLAMGALGWDPAWGRLCVVTSTARPGRSVGRIMQHFGNEALAMRDRKSNTATSLQVARKTRDGISLAFAVDGPEGPAHEAKSVPVDWARLTGCPIWLYAYSVERYWTANTWDRMAVPKPGGRGCMIYRRWDAEIPKRLDADVREHLRQRLQADLDSLTLEADRMMGHDGPIN